MDRINYISLTNNAINIRIKLQIPVASSLAIALILCSNKSLVIDTIWGSRITSIWCLNYSLIYTNFKTSLLDLAFHLLSHCIYCWIFFPSNLFFSHHIFQNEYLPASMWHQAFNKLVSGGWNTRTPTVFPQPSLAVCMGYLNRKNI